MGKPCRLNSLGPSFIEPTSTRRTRRLCLRCGLRSCSTTIPGSIQRRAGQVAGCVIGITLGPPWKRLCAGTSSAWSGAPEEFPRQAGLRYRDSGRFALAIFRRPASQVADWHHLRDGRRLRMAEDQVEFDDVAVPGALSIQRHFFASPRYRRKYPNTRTWEPSGPFRFSGGRFTIRSTEDFRSLLKAARRRYCHSSSGRSIRQRDTHVSASLCGKTEAPVFAWDIMGGIAARNKAAKEAAAHTFGEKAAVGPADVLLALHKGAAVAVCGRYCVFQQPATHLNRSTSCRAPGISATRSRLVAKCSCW